MNILFQINLSHTFPPDAHNEPSGDTVTVLRYPECPL